MFSMKASAQALFCHGTNPVEPIIFGVLSDLG